jgi:hypothetical protein
MHLQSSHLLKQPTSTSGPISAPTELRGRRYKQTPPINQGLQIRCYRILTLRLVRRTSIFLV